MPYSKTTKLLNRIILPLQIGSKWNWKRQRLNRDTQNTLSQTFPRLQWSPNNNRGQIQRFSPRLLPSLGSMSNKDIWRSQLRSSTCSLLRLILQLLLSLIKSHPTKSSTIDKDTGLCRSNSRSIKSSLRSILPLSSLVASRHRSYSEVWLDSSSSITVDTSVIRSQVFKSHLNMLPKSHSHQTMLLLCLIILIHLQTKKITAKIIKQIIIKLLKLTSLKIRTIIIKSSSPMNKRSMRIESHSMWVVRCHPWSAQASRNRGIATVIPKKLLSNKLADLTAMLSQVMPQKLGTPDLITTRTLRENNNITTTTITRAESCLRKDATTITTTNNPLTTTTTSLATKTV